MAIPLGWVNLGFTSGRRTYAGNRMVGGVPNSNHLDGTAADFTASPQALRAFFGPNVKILNEGDHRHVSGLSDVPYYGNQGVYGLKNGVDTTAPKGQPMLGSRKSIQAPAMAAQSPMQDMPLGIDMASSLAPAIDLGQMAQMAQQPKVKKGGLFGTGLGVGEALVYALNGYLAGRGNPAGAANMAMLQRNKEMAFDRDQLNAQIEARRQAAIEKAMEPPQFVQDAQAWSRLPREQQQQVIDMRNAMYPVTADQVQADGSVYRSVIPRTLPGPQTQTIDGVTYYNVDGKWYDNPEGR